MHGLLACAPGCLPGPCPRKTKKQCVCLSVCLSVCVCVCVCVSNERVFFFSGEISDKKGEWIIRRAPCFRWGCFVEMYKAEKPKIEFDVRFKTCLPSAPARLIWLLRPPLR